MEDIKKRLSDAMHIRNIKAVELSEKTKIPKSAISQYLSGYAKPKQDRIYLLAKALNVDETWLLGYDVPMEPVKTSMKVFSDYDADKIRRFVDAFAGCGNLDDVLEALETKDLEEKRQFLESMQKMARASKETRKIIGKILDD